MRKKFLVLLAGFSFGVLVTSLPVIAHHAFSAEFDSTKPVQLRGTITKMEWINPHAWMHIDVTNDDGAVDSWMIEAGPLEPSCDADGERIQWLRAEVLVEGYRAIDNAFRANGRDVTLPDGTRLFAGSSGTGAPLDSRDPTESAPR